MPLFFEQTATLLDYLPANSLLCLHGDLDHSAQQFWREAQSRYRTLAHDAERPILPPETLLIKTEDFFAATHAFARITLSISKTSNNLPALDIERRAEHPLHKLADFIRQFSGRILIVAESLGRRETMHQLFTEHGLAVGICETWADFQTSKAHVMLGVSTLHAGVALTDQAQPIAIITEAELYAATVRQQRRREKEKARSTEGMLKDLSELRINDPVVHEQHGVGRYKGLVSIDFGEGETELLLLEYFGEDKLYVPVSQLFLISRYSGGPPESAPLHRLGSGSWEKAKKKALKQIRDTAAELLNLYACLLYTSRCV